MKQILVLLYGGGLGNRINTLLTALSLYSKIHVPMKIIWYSDLSFMCDFTDIFQDITDPNISVESISVGSLQNPLESISIDYSQYSKSLFVCRDINKNDMSNFYQPPECTDFFCYTKYIYSAENIDIDTFPGELIDKYDTVIFCDPNFLPIDNTIHLALESFIKTFIPKNIRQITEFFRQSKPSVGVHIRLTDKKLINKYSDEQLNTDIEQIFSKFNDKTIFVCSDDLQVETNIVSNRGNCVRFTKSDQVYMNYPFIIRNRESCVDAATDFFIFCACPLKQGINSTEHTSTFFQVSSVLHHTFVKHYGLTQ